MKAKIDMNHPYSALPYINLINDFGKELQKILGEDDSVMAKIKFAVNNAIMKVLEETDGEVH